LIAMLRNGTLELYSMTVQNVMLVAMVFVSAHYLILSFCTITVPILNHLRDKTVL